MKKFILSTSVIILFSLYIYLQRNPLVNPAVPANQVAPTVTPTKTPTLSIRATTTPAPTVQVTATPVPLGKYKDGSYTGSVVDAYYGYIQVRVTVSGGKIANVEFLQYPNDRERSIQINTFAMPILKSEAISAQGANVDIVSGATDSSQAFIQSLASALSQAK